MSIRGVARWKKEGSFGMSPPKRPSLLWLRRTITVFVLSIIIIFPAVTVFPASASASDVKSEPQVVEVSLEECRSLALEHSASVLLAENAVHDARLALEQTEATSLTKPSPTSLYQSRMSLESAGKNLEITKQDVVLGTDQLYYSLLRAEHLVSISRQALDLSERQFEIAMAKESVGMATKLDIMRAENQTASACNSLASALFNRDLATVSLNQAIGFVPETVLSPRDEFSYETSFATLHEPSTVSNQVLPALSQYSLVFPLLFTFDICSWNSFDMYSKGSLRLGPLCYHSIRQLTQIRTNHGVEFTLRLSEESG
jgi:hypothetical protein